MTTPPRDANNANLAAQDAYVVAQKLVIWVPASAFAAANANDPFEITNSYVSPTATSISGQPLLQPEVAAPTLFVPVSPAGAPSGVTGTGGTRNDTAQMSFNILPAGSVDKSYGECQVSLNGPKCLPAGISAYKARDGVQYNGGYYLANLFVTNSGTLSSHYIACEKIDNTKNIFAGAATLPIRVVDNSGSVDTTLVAGVDYIVEYGTGGKGATGVSWATNDDFATGTCADAESPTWHATAAAVPGGFQNITKIRIRSVNPLQASHGLAAQIVLENTATSLVAGFGSPAGTAWPTGTKIVNWVTFALDFFTPGYVFGPVTVIPGSVAASPLGANALWVTGATGVYAGGPVPTTTFFNDVMSQTYAAVRITKETSTPINTATSITAGSSVTYVLKPSLSSPVLGSQPANVQVKDILPPGTTYQVGSASLAPTSVSVGAPSAGYTTIVWDIPNVTPGAAITPITFVAVTDPFAANGAAIPNITSVSSPADATPCQASGGVYDQMLNTGYVNNNATGGGVTGNLCVRAARRDLTLQNPPGFKVAKAVNTSVIQPNGAITYTTSWASVGAGTPPAVIDLIDILPYAGDGRTPATAFAGTRPLAAAPTPVVGDAGATYYYTTAPVASINVEPSDASNGSFGSTAGNTVGWSTTYNANATAVRMISATAMVANSPRSFSFTTQTANNVAGNIYTNRFTARGTGLSLLLTSNDVTTTVVTSSISGKVYVDVDTSGSFTAGDTGLVGIQVCLSGYAFGTNGTDDSGAGDDVAVPANTCQNTVAGGAYSFTGLSSGKYTVTEPTQPPAYNDGAETAGTPTNGSITVNDVISGIVLGVNQNLVDYNFGELAIASVVVSGNVYNDINGLLGAPANTTDGAVVDGSAAPFTALTAYLVRGGTIVASADVNASGAYSFPSVSPNTGYTVVLSNTAGLTGAAPTAALPAGWNNVSDQIGTTAGGATNATPGVSPSFDVVASNVTNVNFGIEQPPTATGTNVASQVNPGGSTAVTVPTANFGMADPAPGTVTSIQFTGSFPANATTITINGTAYTAANWGTGPTVTTTLTSVTVDPIDGAVTVNLPYTVSDAAGLTASSQVQVPFGTVGVSGNVYNDINGLLGAPANTTDGTVIDGSAAPFTALTAYLVRGGTIVASADVNASGAYSFPSVSPNTGYTVVLSNTAGLTGAAPTAALPAGWNNVSDQIGTTAGGATNATPGVSPSFDVVASNVTNVNFGIEQPPTATGTNVASQVNPGGSTAVTVPTANFGMADPAPGAVTSIQFTGSFPANATTITINGTAYTAANWGAGPTVATLTSVTVDPIDGAVTVNLPYTVSDAAGLTASSQVQVPFSTVGVSGNVYNDLNGLLGAPANTVDGTGTNAGSATLTAYLVRGGNVVASNVVLAGGTYSFSNVTPNTGYTVVLSNTGGVANGAAAPAASLPASWVNTGENIGAGAGSDGTVNGVSASFDVVATNVTNVNFGIRQLADMTSKIVCTPTSGLPGTAVSCAVTCTNNGPGAAINAFCSVTNASSLPGNPTPTCSPSADVPLNGTLTCSVSFAMPASPGTILVNAGTGADNDSNGGSVAAAGNNPTNAMVIPDIPVPTLADAWLALVALLLAGLGATTIRRRLI